MQILKSRSLCSIAMKQKFDFDIKHNFSSKEGKKILDVINSRNEAELGK